MLNNVFKGEVQQWDRGRSIINIKSQFQLETTIRNDSLYFCVYLSNIDSETAEKKGDFEFWAWAPHFIMIWNITVRYKLWRTNFSRMPNMQVLYHNYVRNHMKAMLHWEMCACVFKFELN